MKTHFSLPTLFGVIFFLACHQKEPLFPTVDPQMLAYAEGHYRRYFYSFENNGMYVIPEFHEQFARLTPLEDAVSVELPMFDLRGLAVSADSILVLPRSVFDKIMGKWVTVHGEVRLSARRFDVNLRDKDDKPYFEAVFFRDDPPQGPLSRADYLGDYRAYPDNNYAFPQTDYPFRIKPDSTANGVLLENALDGLTIRGWVSGDTLYTGEYPLDSANVVKPLQAVLQTSFIKLNFVLNGPAYPPSYPNSFRERYCLKQ